MKKLLGLAFRNISIIETNRLKVKLLLNNELKNPDEWSVGRDL